jgi:hypothetical protein
MGTVFIIALVLATAFVVYCVVDVLNQISKLK